MTPKEKAIEIINKFIPHVLDIEYNEDMTINKDNYYAKQCALILVDEVIFINSGYILDMDISNFWYDVKKEIKNFTSSQTI